MCVCVWGEGIKKYQIIFLKDTGQLKLLIMNINN